VAAPSLHSAVAAACAELERRREAVNLLNVFPVADGDTGDNMALTARGVLDALTDGSSHDEVARRALLAARGNSGVLLAQWVRGAVGGVTEAGGAPVGPRLLAAALRAGAGAAHDALANPAPGTILAAMAAAADGAAASADGSLADSVARALAEAEAATERGRDQLRELREAGVVDAGAAGFTALLSGALNSLMGRPAAGPSGGDAHADGAAPSAAPNATPDAGHGDASNAPDAKAAAPDAKTAAADAASRAADTVPALGPRYCTNLAVTGTQLDRPALVRRLAMLGDSLLVVGDSSLLRVHLHTNDPEAAEASCAGAGRVARREVADMWDQARKRRAASP
jgi:dihydroxyacetone kinase-like predicted kinase